MSLYATRWQRQLEFIQIWFPWLLPGLYQNSGGHRFTELIMSRYQDAVGESIWLSMGIYTVIHVDVLLPLQTSAIGHCETNTAPSHPTLLFLSFKPL